MSVMMIFFSLCFPSGKSEENMTTWRCPPSMSALSRLSFPSCSLSSTPVTFPLSPSSSSSSLYAPSCPLSLSLCRSASCSWSNTPCCGWSNGTKSGVSVRFGPLQPATASWIQSADTGESQTHRDVVANAARCRGGRVFIVRDSFSSLVVCCWMFHVWLLMLIKDRWQYRVVN